MSKLFIENSTLTAIGDAIREKTGKTALIAPGAMPAEIKSIVSGGGGGEGDCNGLHIPEEALVITGNCDNRFRDGWTWFIESFGDKMSSADITNANCMFMSSTLNEIPFELNFKEGTDINMNAMFQGCSMKTAPIMNNAKPSNISSLFSGCDKLETVPANLGSNWDWSYIETQTSSYQGNTSGLFNGCKSLRAVPKTMISHANPYSAYSNSACSTGFTNCYSLSVIEDLAVPTETAWTSNAFSSTFKLCCRLKKLTFKKQADGTPYAAKWKSQTIDLSEYIGYGANQSFYNQYLPNWGFTDATKITNQSQRTDYRNASARDTTPGTFEYDGWTDDYAWSTFGATATREFFDSLPDTSAYLASAGGTNTIKLKRTAAMNDPFDKMSLLTEEDIAVAAAKGWTVSLV